MDISVLFSFYDIMAMLVLLSIFVTYAFIMEAELEGERL